MKKLSVLVTAASLAFSSLTFAETLTSGPLVIADASSTQEAAPVENKTVVKHHHAKKHCHCAKCKHHCKCKTHHCHCHG